MKKRIHKDPREIASILADLYEQKFGGKSGRFQMTRDRLRELTGRIKLQAGLIDQISDYCDELGFLLINRDEAIVIIKHSTMEKYRQPSADTVEGYDPISSQKKSSIKPGTRVRKEFEGEDFEGIVRRVYTNGKIFVVYDDESFEVTTIDEIEPIEEDK